MKLSSNLLHNLSHGGIGIHYDCETECNDLISKLDKLRASDDTQIVLSPYRGMKSKIALTSWRHVQFLEEFDEEAINIFIKAYRYILDIDSVVYFIQKTYHIQNETIDMIQDKPFTIFEIVESFERCLNLKAKYHTVNKGDYFKVDNSKFKKSLLNQEELDRYSNISYLDTIIKKYY